MSASPSTRTTRYDVLRPLVAHWARQIEPALADHHPTAVCSVSWELTQPTDNYPKASIITQHVDEATGRILSAALPLQSAPLNAMLKFFEGGLKYGAFVVRPGAAILVDKDVEDWIDDGPPPLVVAAARDVMGPVMPSDEVSRWWGRRPTLLGLVGQRLARGEWIEITEQVDIDADRTAHQRARVATVLTPMADKGVSPEDYLRALGADPYLNRCFILRTAAPDADAVLVFTTIRSRHRPWRLTMPENIVAIESLA